MQATCAAFSITSSTRNDSRNERRIPLRIGLSRITRAAASTGFLPDTQPSAHPFDLPPPSKLPYRQTPSTPGPWPTMVNTGKPSTGCHLCRARRIKCDEARPACLKCQKSKRVCPGYRDPAGLKLRDKSKSKKNQAAKAATDKNALSQAETVIPIWAGNAPESESTDPELESWNMDIGNGTPAAPWPSFAEAGRRRVGGRLAVTQTISPPCTEWDRSFSDLVNHPVAQNRPFPQNTTIMRRLSRSLSDPSILASMHPSIDERATTFFVANYILSPGTETRRGHLNFVLPILAASNKADDPLRLAFGAVGLATLGTRPEYKCLLGKAAQSYVKALNSVNEALVKPKAAIDDSVLATILLLTVFEQIHLTDQNLRGWNSHINGAVALIKARGNSLTKNMTSTSQDLMLSVRELMTIQYIARSYPVDFGIEFWTTGVFANDRESPVMQEYARLNLEVANLRAATIKVTALATRSIQNIESVLSLLRTAETLEKDYRIWCITLPSSWEPRSVDWADEMDVVANGGIVNSPVHPGRVDSYNELSLAYVYNISRASQILIWTTILRCVAWLGEPLDYRITPEYNLASQICKQHIDDIVASVPYFFGWKKSAGTASSTGSSHAKMREVKGVSAVYSMWPLFTAATSDFSSQSQRDFLRGRLRHISEQMGITQAQVLLQAPLLHPSMHIAQERLNQQPHTIKSSTTQVVDCMGNKRDMRPYEIGDHCGSPTMDGSVGMGQREIGCSDRGRSNSGSPGALCGSPDAIGTVHRASSGSPTTQVESPMALEFDGVKGSPPFFPPELHQ